MEAKKGHIYMQWIAAIIANSSLLTYGLQVGWISPMTKVLQSSSSPAGEPLSDYTMGLVASLMPICAMVTVPVYGFIANKYGRKAGIMCITIIHAEMTKASRNRISLSGVTKVPTFVTPWSDESRTFVIPGSEEGRLVRTAEISWLLKLICPSPTTLIIARVCSGMAAGGCYNVIPMYTKEISQDQIRGQLGSLLNFFMNIGIFAMFVLGAYCDYYTILYIVVLGPFLSFLLIMMCPESPGFLVKKGRFDEAVKVIAGLRGLSPDDRSVQSEAEAMRKEEEYYKTLPTLSIRVILKYRAWRKGYFLAALMMTAQTFSGNFAVLTYGSAILEGTGSQLDPGLVAISFPAIMLVGSVVSILVVERIGRRVILGSSYAVSTISQGCLATVLLLQYQGYSAPGWLPLLAIVATMFVYSYGVLPVPYIVLTELFNIQIRAKLLSMIVTQMWLLTFIQLAVFGPLTSAFGLHTTFFIFAAINLFGALLVLFLIPETRGKSVEEIETKLRET